MLRIISVHIPKTGGNSLLQCLRQEGPVCIRSWPVNEGAILDHQQAVEDIGDARILHGHFPLECYRPWITGQTKIITWLRNPVSRIISHWHHIQRGSPDMTLEEFCQKEYVPNMMSRMLAGFSLKDFFFVGIFERFGEDLTRLQDTMGWPHHRPHKNKGGWTDLSGVSKQALERVVLDNQKDMQLYLDALSL